MHVGRESVGGSAWLTRCVQRTLQLCVACEAQMLTADNRRPYELIY